MTMFRRLFHALPLAGALLLAACGGGSDGNPGTPPAPAPTTPVTEKFIARAQTQPCADRSNRLFVIDQKYVFWEVTGSCSDASYAYGLFGTTPEAELCVQADSIAGPKTTCKDTSVKPMFDTIVANLKAPNLGLAASYKVEQLHFLPKDGVFLPYTSVTKEAFSGIHAPRTVVIKDAAALATLWAEHNANRTPAAPVPAVDFNTHMLVGVFLGDNAGCKEFGIHRILVSGTKIRVEYEVRDITPVTVCVAAVTSPMHLVAIARSPADVEFASVKVEQLAFSDVGSPGTELEFAL